MRHFLLLSAILLVQLTFGQDKEIDKLEILYDQGYYAKVYRKSNKLMANPLYDYSGLPKYYKALAIFRLADDDRYFKKHPKCIFEAIDLFRICESNERYSDYLSAHYFEVAQLKTYLIELNKTLEAKNLTGSSEALTLFIEKDLNGVVQKPLLSNEIAKDDKGEPINENSSVRDKMVVYATSLIGVKYVWAGQDENGFDCSGFTSFVHKKYGIIISRTASGQKEDAKTVKLTNTQKADLVFFGTGEKISHVGMVVSDKSKELTMVHASTSKGVIVTNIEQSTYWKPKLKAAGTYIEG